MTGDALQSNGDTPQLSEGTAGSFLGETWGYGMDRADCFAFSPLGMMHREMYVCRTLLSFAIMLSLRPLFDQPIIQGIRVPC